MFDARFSWFSSSNSLWNWRSRLNAWTIAIPATDSATCAVTAAMRLRTSSCATADLRWNHRESASAGGRITMATSPRRQSTTKSTMTVVGRRTTFETSVGRPCERASEIASTSLVTRAMIHPARCSEK